MDVEAGDDDEEEAEEEEARRTWKDPVEPREQPFRTAKGKSASPTKKAKKKKTEEKDDGDEPEGWGEPAMHKTL